METKLKFKVGDRVRVKSLEWYNSSKGAKGNILSSEIAGVDFVKGMDIFCGQVSQIQEVSGNYYILHDCGCYCWQDWMLEDEIFTEDEPVTEVKQEIEQPHKKKTRVLTKEVAQAIVRCTKYRLENKNESTQLQEKLFEIGCKWLSGCRNVQYTSDRYLFVSSNLNITCSDIKEQYIKDFSQELEVNDVLNITIAEVKEIEKTDMETKEMKKEMTQQEVLEYLNDTKILCTSKEESEKVQEKLFELGLKWKTAEKRIVFFAFLFIIIDKKIQFTDSMEWWVKSNQKQIEPSEILEIQLKEEKPKFDPKTLQDFQKVLYRSSNADWWRLGFFDTYNETQDNKFWIIGKDVQPYEQCVPYNEETEHLKGTSEEAPEFYRG